MKLIRWLLACVLLLCLQVTLHGSSESGSGVDFYRAVLDEKGNPRRLAVKRMPWDIINKKLGKVREVSYNYNHPHGRANKVLSQEKAGGRGKG